MKTSAALFCAALVAGSVPAQGVYNMAKQQAVGTPGQASPAQPPQNNQQPDPALQATLQNIGNLRVDFDDLGSGRTNTVALQNDLTTAALGARPSPAAVTKLAGDLAAALTGNKKLQAQQQQKLAQYCHAMFNSSHLSAAQQQKVLDAVQKILSDGGVSTDDVTKVIADLKAVATATK